MKPIDFEDANIRLSSENPDIDDLPSFKGDGFIVTRWRSSFRERLSMLFFGNVWVCLLADKHPPISIVGGREAYWEFPGQSNTE